MTADELVVKVTATCDKVGGVTYDASGHHPHYGSGRINAEQAVT
jgi:thermitase